MWVCSRIGFERYQNTCVISKLLVQWLLLPVARNHRKFSGFTNVTVLYTLHYRNSKLITQKLLSFHDLCIIATWTIAPQSTSIPKLVQVSKRSSLLKTLMNHNNPRNSTLGINASNNSLISFLHSSLSLPSRKQLYAPPPSGTILRKANLFWSLSGNVLRVQRQSIKLEVKHYGLV